MRTARKKKGRTACQICGDHDGKVLPKTAVAPREVVRVMRTRAGNVCNNCARYVGAYSAEEVERIG